MPDGDAVVAVANRLRGARPWAAVVRTLDAHPPDHASFAANHAGGVPFTTVTLQPEGHATGLWPTHCVAGSPGAAALPGLAVEPADVVVAKGTHPRADSYSGFGDAHGGRYERTPLAAELTARGVRAVVVLGLATDFCVDATARDAAALGLRVLLPLDGCRGITPEGTAAAVERMARAGVEVFATAEDALAALR